MDDVNSGAGLSKDQEITALRSMVDTLNGEVDASKSLVDQKAQATTIALYDEQIGASKYNLQMLEWQLFASNIMLWVVVVVVISGVVFSGIQLFHAMRLGQNTDGSFEVSAQGLKVTSAVVGIIILAMSIAFVIIFVDQIYSPHTVTLFDASKSN